MHLCEVPGKTVFSLQQFVITGDFKFVSATYRLFKVPKGSTDRRQAVYNGSITGVEDSFEFDCQYTFKVC